MQTSATDPLLSGGSAIKKSHALLACALTAAFACAAWAGQQQLLHRQQALGAGGGPGAGLSFDELAAAAQCPRLNWTSVAFLHVPKAAGTTFIKMLESMLYSRGQRWCPYGKTNPNNFRYQPLSSLYPWDCAVVPPLRQAMLPEDVAAIFPSACQGFNTHLGLDLLEASGVDFGRDLTAVNLRRPVDRLVSAFFFTLRTLCDFNATTSFSDKVWCHGSDERYTPVLDLVNSSPTLGSALRQYAGRDVVRNRMTQQLAGSFGCAWRGQHAAAPPPGDVELLAAAKAALSRFCLLLISDRLPESVEVLEAAHGGRLPLGGEVRENPTAHPTPPPQLLAELESLQHLDNQLYTWALQLFDARLRRLRR